jgi:hypothetical protein
MPEPLSAIAFCVTGYAALNGYARGRSAVSSEAHAAQQAAIAVVDSAERSQSLFGEKAAAISRLSELAYERDDYEAKPEPVALFMAEQFVRALPDTVPIPEFAIEPDGSVSMDWIRSRNQMFSLSVGTNHRLAYAWLDGADKGHGVAGFDGERIPPKVIDGIREIMNHGNITLRIA